MSSPIKHRYLHSALMTVFSWLYVFTAVCVTNSHVHGKWIQTRYFLSFWVDPLVPPSEFVVQYQAIADAHFTAVLGGFGATNRASVAEQISACNATGLDCVPTTCEGLDGPWGTNTSCVGVGEPMGYQVMDEPSASQFDQLAEWAVSLQQRAPDALRFINLLPNYFLPPPSSVAYEAYVAQYVTTVHPDILCFDHYPMFFHGSQEDTSSDVTMAGYRRNLAIIRNASLAAGIPFFNFFGGMPYGNRADFSESELRWQAFTSMGYGSKGLLYFCYWTPAGAEFVWGHAMVTPVGFANGTTAMVRSPRYYQAQRINKKIVAFGSFLLPYHSSAAETFQGTTSTPPQPASASSSCVSNVSSAGAGPSWHVLLGSFVNATPQPLHPRSFLLHNQDVNKPTIITLGLKGVNWNENALEEVDAEMGELRPVADDCPDIPGLQLYLLAGDARLFAC